MALSKAYLIVYNLACCFGWGYLMLRLWPCFQLQLKNTNGFPPAKNPLSLYKELGFHVRVVQTAAILEILHAVFGLVRSNPMVVATQIFR